MTGLKALAEAYALTADEAQKAKRDAKNLPRTFEEVVPKVRDRFGQDSMQYIVFALLSRCATTSASIVSSTRTSWTTKE